jgi:hypothetical protein
MNYRDHLIMRARSYWGKDQQLPTTLFSEMIAEGIDLDYEERAFNDTQAD